jgi:hypothetical protein
MNDFGFAKTSFTLSASKPFTTTLTPTKNILKGSGPFPEKNPPSITPQWSPEAPKGVSCSPEAVYAPGGEVSFVIKVNFTPPADRDDLAGLQNKKYTATFRQQGGGAENPTSTVIFAFGK